MSDFANLAVGLVMAGSAVVGATRKVLERRRARRALRSKPLLAQETPEGEVVRVTGVVKVGEATLVAPISGRACVVYRSRVTDGMWTVRRAMLPNETFEMVPFTLVRDDGSKVEISGKHALLDLPNLKFPESTPELVERRDKFMELHKIKSGHAGVFEEIVVEDGMRVSVAGLMMKDLAEAPVDGEAGYRDEAPSTLRLAGDVAHPLVIGAP